MTKKKFIRYRPKKNLIMTILEELLAHAERLLQFDIIFDSFQQSLLSLNNVAVDFVEDLNIVIQDLLIHTDSHNEILSWNGSTNNEHSSNKFCIIVNNQELYNRIETSKVLQIVAYPSETAKQIEEYTLMIHKKEDFDYINNNQVFFNDYLPDYKRFMIMNQQDCIILKNRVIECTILGSGNDIIKLTPDVELNIKYLGGKIKVFNKILDGVNNEYIYVSNYIYNSININTTLLKNNEPLTNFNTSLIKPLDQLEDFQICINFLNVVDNQLQTIGTSGEEFEVDFNTKTSITPAEIEKYEYFSGDMTIDALDITSGINLLNMNNGKVYEIHKLCHHYAISGEKVILIDVPFLINAIKDKKMSLSDLVNIYILGRKRKVNETVHDNMNIYELMTKFFNDFKKFVPECNKDITVVIKNADYLFINNVLKKEERISCSYYKWQAYFLNLNNFVEDVMINSSKNIQIIIQSEDFEDHTKFPRLFDDLYLIHNKSSYLKFSYREEVNDYRDYLNMKKNISDYVEISKRPKNISEVNPTDDITLGKPVYGITTTMEKIANIFTKSVIFKKLYEAQKMQNLNILIYGLPSMGKTLIINQLHEYLVKKHRIIPKNSYFKYYNTLSLISKYVGESEKNVRTMFSQGREYIKNNNGLYFIILDNIDTLLPRRGDDNSNITDKLVNTFLTELDGIDSLISNKNLVVVCVTNRPDKVDPAVLRPGRIENHIKVEYNKYDFKEIVEQSMKDYEVSGLTVEEVMSVRERVTVGGMLKIFNEKSMSKEMITRNNLVYEEDLIKEYEQYMNKFENKIATNVVDTEETYM